MARRPTDGTKKGRLHCRAYDEDVGEEDEEQGMDAEE